MNGQQKRIGIRGYRIVILGEGIIYAQNGHDALRKLGEDLIKASQETECDLHIPSLARGSIDLTEIGR